MTDAVKILQHLRSEVQAGRRAALCAIVATKGSTPQPAGSMVCVDQNAGMTGTLGGGCVEADVCTRARQAISRGKSELLSFKLDFEHGLDEGMICGGKMDVAVCLFAEDNDAERLDEIEQRIQQGWAATIPLVVESADGRAEYRLNIEAKPRLVIAGGGHVGRLVAEMMVPLGFDVTVIDDREEYANSERFKPPIKPVVGHIADTLSNWSIDANTYVVLVTRGHRHDQRALAAVLDSPARYIGMIGSRRKLVVLFKDLKEDGATDEQLARVHSPIGLKINAVTTEEIALSIAAELVSVRRAAHRPAVEGPFTHHA